MEHPTFFLFYADTFIKLQKFIWKQYLKSTGSLISKSMDKHLMDNLALIYQGAKSRSASAKESSQRSKSAGEKPLCDFGVSEKFLR